MKKNATDVFFFNDTATTEIYTLSLHDALPILRGGECVMRCICQPVGRFHGFSRAFGVASRACRGPFVAHRAGQDRKSTRLNSSHANISYAVFCLKKKKSYALYRYHYLHT